MASSLGAGESHADGGLARGGRRAGAVDMMDNASALPTCPQPQKQTRLSLRDRKERRAIGISVETDSGGPATQVHFTGPHAFGLVAVSEESQF